MPTHALTPQIRFKYGKTWRVQPTTDAQVVELMPASVHTDGETPLERWWIRWAAASSAVAAWDAICAPPDDRYAGLSVWDRWGNRVDPQVTMRELPRERRVRIADFYKGTSADGRPLGGFVGGDLYENGEDGRDQVLAVAVLAFGDLDLVLKRLNRGDFREGLTFEPWEARRNAWVDEQNRRTAPEPASPVAPPARMGPPSTTRNRYPARAAPEDARCVWSAVAMVRCRRSQLPTILAGTE